MRISAGGHSFAVTLYDNETTRALRERLPLSLHMSELNGNEKYHYLEEALPTNAAQPAGIQAGDLMLYGSDCLVLFYQDFTTPYSYTPLGRVEDANGLQEALGDGAVEVTFALE